MKTVAVVQARMGSSRLPGKVLMPVGPVAMVARVAEAARAAAGVDECWIACPEGSADDPIARLADGIGVACLRGDEHDVLSRFLAVGRRAGADRLVRLTADCPLLDPDVVGRVIALLGPDSGLDYASNVAPRSFPRGLDVEAMRLEALERIAREPGPDDREHVTVTLRTGRGGRFRTATLVADSDDSDLRWTVDTAEDLAFVRRLDAAVPMAGRSYRQLVARCRSDSSLYRADTAAGTWDPTRSEARAG
ncbi:MAG: NTP transferase domain-containing protein [Gemmatimonadales bacterium]